MDRQSEKLISSGPKMGDWFGKIETRDQAFKIIKDCAKGFYFFAGMQGLLGYFVLGPLVVIESLLLGLLAFLLHRFQSFIAAAFLLIFSALGVISTGINQFGGGSGGRNIVLAIIIFWMSVRAVQATTKLHRL